MKYSVKINKILAFSGWTRDRLADLLQVSNFTMGRWLRGGKPKVESAEIIDELYGLLVEPFVADLEVRADKIEKKLLQKRIARLPHEFNHK
jgi:hypothetical protein